jgi:transcription antitermination factor NusA-like protein
LDYEIRRRNKMKFMHTKLPEFIKKLNNAAIKELGEGSIEIRGLENLKSAKMQSLRTGRIEDAVEEIAMGKDIEKVVVTVMPRVPETMHTVIIKGIDKNGNAKKAILEVINIIHPTEEIETFDCSEVEDRRPALGRH